MTDTIVTCFFQNHPKKGTDHTKGTLYGLVNRHSKFAKLKVVQESAEAKIPQKEIIARVQRVVLFSKS